jgi:hypothetical protein
MVKIWIVFLLIIISCRSENKKLCLFEDRSSDGKLIYIDGCFKNGKEDGHWKFSDSLGNVYKEGDYSEGLLKGLWKYSYSNQKEYSFFWEKYENEKFKIKTNIPDFLNKIKEGYNDIRFDKSDTSSKLTLVIALLDTANLPFPLDSLYLQSEKEIKERGWSSEKHSKILNSKERTVYMNWYKISKDGSQRYILESYGRIGGTVIVITTQYDLLNDAEGRLLFTSVSSNLFLNGERYMRPYISPH